MSDELMDEQPVPEAADGLNTETETTASGEEGEFEDEDAEQYASDEAASPPPAERPDQALLGQLVAHYENRDVTFVVDGETALRLLTMFARRSELSLADRIDPYVSSAASMWLVLDIHEPLAMTWLPGLPATRRRTAVDPAPTSV